MRNRCVFFVIMKQQKSKTPVSRGKKEKSAEVKLLAQRIKDLRLKKGYTNYEYFAYEHNISRTQFGRYENGEDMRFSSLIKIVKAFDMTLVEFFTEGFENIADKPQQKS